MFTVILVKIEETWDVDVCEHVLYVHACMYMCIVPSLQFLTLPWCESDAHSIQTLLSQCGMVLFGDVPAPSLSISKGKNGFSTVCSVAKLGNTNLVSGGYGALSAFLN